MATVKGLGWRDLSKGSTPKGSSCKGVFRKRTGGLRKGFHYGSFQPRRERRELRNFQQYVLYEVTFRGLKHLILANFRLFDHRHISNEIITLRTS